MKIKNYFKIVITTLMTISLLFSTIKSELIIPDAQNPILFYEPNTTKAPRIDIRFNLSSDSKGLVYGQYIGVAFPTSVLTDLQFDKDSVKYSCLLTDGTTSYALTAEKPASSTEGNIAFCKLSDMTNNSLKTGSKYNYKLTLTLTPKITAKFIRSFKLFTSTSTSANRIIIDQLYFVGNIGQYDDPLSFSNKAIDVTSAQIVTGNTSNVIYPYQVFDTTLNIKSNIFISARDYTITFKFNKSYVVAAQSVVTTAISTTNPLEAALKGALTLTQYSSGDQVAISGITEDLVPGRSFQLTLKSWKALDNFTNSNSSLDMIVYYKNTYSVVSYVGVSSNFFRISYPTLNLTVEHPSGWDIFRNGVFPMKFTFSSPIEITNGGYVLLRQTNTIDEVNRWNFVAATCDFSENESLIDQSFGKRPQCFPIRTDFVYTASNSSSGYAGSGIFFKLKPISAGKNYVVTVWGSADSCGGNTAITQYGSANTSNTGTNVQFSFQATIYRDIKASETNENRLINQTILGQSSTTAMKNKCWNNMIILRNYATPTEASGVAILPFEETVFKTVALTDTTSSFSPTTNHVNMYREFYDVQLGGISSNSPAPANYFQAMGGATSFSEFFIYGTNSITTLSYFSLRAGFNVIKGKLLHESIPSPIGWDGTAYRIIQGRLVLNLQKQWFTYGDAANTTSPGCYLGWGTDATETNNNQYIGNKAFYNPGGTTDCQTNDAIGPVQTFIGTFVNSSCATTDKTPFIETDKSFIPVANSTTSNSYYRIMSKWHSGSSTTVTNKGFMFPGLLTDITTKAIFNDAKINIGLFSTCFKWNTNVPIKSLYASIDVQLNWLYAADQGNFEGPPVRAIRFIKLFPEGGAFQDISSSAGTKLAVASSRPDATSATTRSFKYHVSHGSNNTNVGVCLIEIYGKGLQDASDSATTNLGIWIGFGVLLETDYDDTSATYPVGPLFSSNYKTYGFQSGYIMNKKENFNLILDATNQGVFAHTTINNTNKNPFTMYLHNYSLTPKATTSPYTSAMGGTTFDDTLSTFPLRSSYLFLMGSFVLINGITSNNVVTTTNSTADNLLIPVYCPVYESNTIVLGAGMPQLYMAYINMSSFSNITSITRIYSHKVASNDYMTVVTPNVKGTIDSYKSSYTTLANALTQSTSYFNYLFTLRWTTYSNTNSANDNNLYIYYGNVSGTFSADTNQLNCTGHSFLINTTNITVDTTVTKSSSFSGSTPGFHNGTTKFYYLGNEFHKAVLIGIGASNDFPSAQTGTGVFSANTITDETTDRFLTGIKRPTVETFFKNGSFASPFNSIAYFCNSIEKSITQIFTNYINYTTTKGFIVDFNAPSSSPKTFTVKLGLDKSEGPYKNDPAGNIRIEFTLPAKAPGATSINLYTSSTTMTSNTRCGLSPISTSSSPVTECTTDTSLITCPLDRTDTTFVVCCYNVKIEGDSIALSQLYVSVPAQPVIGSTPRFNTSTLYTASSQISSSPNPFTYTFTQSSYIDIIGTNTSNAKITKVDYQQVVQESGFGKVIFTVTIPREPVRNMLLTISGDFSGMYIQNSSPRCIATFSSNFGANWESTADILIDSCELKSFNTSASQIIISTKNMVYKCSQSFTSKTLTIIILPIIVVNWSVTPYSSNPYTTTMTLNTSTKEGIAYNTGSFLISSTLTYAAKPLAALQYDTLCAVSSVTPKIPGEYADYQFDIDLDINKTALVNATPNEITIFFPFNLYGSQINNILCYNNNVLLNCSFTDEGVLNIRFTTALAVGSGKKIPIIITGIYNPTFDSDIYFPCSVNTTNFTTGIRTNLVTGSGKLVSGIALPNGFTQGGLRFLNLASEVSVSNNNPRNISTYTFRVAFDTAITTLNFPLTIANAPQLIITFPQDFNLAWYSSVRVSATIDEYTTDSANSFTKTSFTPASVTQSGNRVTITINSNSYIFSNRWAYWDVIVSNVTGPLDNSSLNAFGTAGPFSLILTNSNYSVIYSTPNNLNNYSTTVLPSKIDNFIENNRGLEFKFDNTKWVIDINTSGVLNTLRLKPGRFALSSFTIKSNPSNTILPRNGSISLTDQSFKLAASSYPITSATYQGVAFYIGTPCNTAPGSYLLNFSLATSDSTSFAPMPPVSVLLDNSTKGLITITTPAPIPEASSTFVNLSLSEPNVDSLVINWTAAEANKNDSTAVLNSITIPAASIAAGSTFTDNNFSTLFSITNSSQKNAQSFKPVEVNKCFDFSISTVTINISGIQAIIPNDYNFSSSFKYYNSDSDPNLKTKNAVKFNFNPPYSPIYLFCALVCFNRDYPSDDTILAAKSGSGDNFIRYYNTMFNSKTASDIIFDNLIRGLRYKLRCIIQSTQGNTKDRTSARANIEQINSLNETISQIIPTNPTKTQCVQYYFTSDPGQATKIAIVNYCQKIFSNNGWSQSGCIICTDSGLTYNPPGLSLPNNLTCTSTASKARLRFLQSSNNSTLTPTTAGSTVNPALVNQSNPITFSVCPIQHPICPSDVSGNKLYSDYFNQLIADTKTTALFVTNLAITNVPINSTFVVSDNVAPDLSKNFAVQILAVNSNGLVQFSVSYPSALKCSWQIAETSSAPASGLSITQCTDTQWCGQNFNVGNIASNTATNVNNLKPFTSGRSYSVYFACANDIPFSTSISNVYSVPFSLPNTSTNTTPTTPTNTNPTNTTSTGNSGNYAYINYFVLVLLAFLF